MPEKLSYDVGGNFYQFPDSVEHFFTELSASLNIYVYPRAARQPGLNQYTITIGIPAPEFLQQYVETRVQELSAKYNQTLVSVELRPFEPERLQHFPQGVYMTWLLDAGEPVFHRVLTGAKGYSDV